MKRTIEQLRDETVDLALSELADVDPNRFRLYTEREMERRLKRAQALRLTSQISQSS